jgi:hypothetical protein
MMNELIRMIKAEAEAKMIKQIQDMLHGSTFAERTGSEGDG